MLSDVAIKCFIDAGDVNIVSRSDINIRSASICLKLDDTIGIFSESSKEIDPDDSSTYPELNKVIINDDFIIKPNQIILASTLEYIGLSNKISGHVSNISGLARLGLNVILSTHISPGFGWSEPRPITLEIHNVSSSPIVLRPNMRICHLILFELNPPASFGYDDAFPNKYRNNKASKSEYSNC